MNSIASYQEFTSDSKPGAPLAYLQFATPKQAWDYRAAHGGGYIFACENGPAYLFPLGMPATPVLLHPLAHGRNGKLIGTMLPEECA